MTKSMTYLMVFNFLRNTHARWIPLITVAYVPTFLTVITMTQTQNLTFLLSTIRTSLVVMLESSWNPEHFLVTVKMKATTRDDDDLNSSRQEKLYWCKCTHCTVMPTFIECRFCRECFTVYSLTNLKMG